MLDFTCILASNPKDARQSSIKQVLSSLDNLNDFEFTYSEEKAHVIKRITQRWFRARCYGMENIPNQPFIAVGNHSGGTMLPDVLVWLSHYYASKPTLPLRTLAHGAIFDYGPRKLLQRMTKMGVIRAEPRQALHLLEQGQALQIYPGSDLDACRSFADRNTLVFAGQQAYVKLAKKVGVPIVPVVSIGGHEALVILSNGVRLARLLKLEQRTGLKACPVSLCLPWGIWLGPLPPYLPLPTQITTVVLPPVLAEGSVDEIDQQVRLSMQQCLDKMAHKRRYLGV